MPKLFSRNSSTAVSERDVLATKYRNARMNLLVVIVASLVNVILAATGSETYYLFSASVPYLITFIAAFMCGKMPPAYYEEQGYKPELPGAVLAAAVVVAVVMIGLYALAFFMSSKNRSGWLVFAVVMFCIDTLVLFLYAGIDPTCALDYLFHLWVIVLLAMGLRANAKLKALPEEPIPALGAFADGQSGEQGAPMADLSFPVDSTPLRVADMSVKYKVLLQATDNGKTILYRRVKRVNELVIGNYVYAEYEAAIEWPHKLSAMVDGRLYEAELTASSRSVLSVNKQQIASKVRLI